MDTKICTKCKIEKHIDQFRKDRTKKDGLYSSCSLCCSKKKIIPPRTHCNKGHESTPDNVEKGKKRNVCIICRDIRTKRYRNQNIDIHKKKASNYQKANREKTNKRMIEYRKKPLPKARRVAEPIRRRALRFKNNPQTSVDDKETIQYIITLLSDPCSYCGNENGGIIDHIVPLEKSGSNHWSNLTSACVSCNSSKTNKPLISYLAYRKEYCNGR